MMKKFLISCFVLTLGRTQAFAQSCPLCRLALIHSPEGRNMIQSFNLAILFLLAVAFLIPAVLAFLFFSKQRRPLKVFTTMILGAGFLFLVLAAITNGAGAWLSSSTEAPPKKLPVYWKIPQFDLIERSGKPFSGKEFSGKIWIADFVYTRCPEECPLLSAHMARLQKTFMNDPNVIFVSFSVDPRYDRPKILSSYANRYGAKKGKWYFLTGDEKKMAQLIQKGFHLPLVLDPHESLSPKKAPEVTHTMKFVLVDPAGKVRGIYDGQEIKSLPIIRRDTQALEQEGRKAL